MRSGLAFAPLVALLASSALPASVAGAGDGIPSAVEIVDAVVVPVPREVFSALDQLGSVNWSAMVRRPEFVQTPERHATALVFGVVIAEGFIAVQARDAEATKRLGPHVLDLADLLGVKDAVTAHAKAIVDGADAGDWDGVRRELDRTQGTVRQTMTRMRDERLAQFVSMGGWLRGTEAAAEAVLAGFDADKAELLHQPDLVAHFERVVATLDGRAAEMPTMTRIRLDLPDLKDVMGKPDLDEEAVARIRDICRDLVGTVMAGVPPGPAPPEEEGGAR